MVVERVIPVARDKVARRQRALDVRRAQRRQEGPVLGPEAVELLAHGQRHVAEDGLAVAVGDDVAVGGRVDVGSVWVSGGGPFCEELRRAEVPKGGVGAELVAEGELLGWVDWSEAGVAADEGPVLEGDTCAGIGVAVGGDEGLFVFFWLLDTLYATAGTGRDVMD